MSEETREVSIRPAREADVEAMTAIVAEVFGPFAVDRKIEEMLGRAGEASWVETKGAHIRRAVAAECGSCFVAEAGGRVVGFVTTTINRPASRGTIADLAVAAACQGRGLGRQLILHALDCFRRALRLFPHDATCRAHLARLYHKMGLAREARRQVRIALKIDAKDRDAQRMAKGLGMLD